MNDADFVLKGDFVWSASPHTLAVRENAALVCIDGRSAGVFDAVPSRYASLPALDFSRRLIVPGLTDLHVHAPQFAFRALGMDLELLPWLERRAFPEEAKYASADYARAAYAQFARAVSRGPNTRLCVFATIHTDSALILMELLEASGVIAFVGKVNMDRNAPPPLTEDTAASVRETRRWLEAAASFERCKPILTPRFFPSCSEALLEALGALRAEFPLPVQSHLSENRAENEWVKSLAPWAAGYAAAYDRYGLLGGAGAPAVMAHCVWSGEAETALLRERGTFAAHCPQSNTNLSSGIAPVKRLMEAGVRAGLGSDIAGGASLSIFRAMADAVGASKLRRFLPDGAEAPLTLEEAFYLGTAGGGAFFGKAGSFDEGYELDALVIGGMEGEGRLASPFPLSPRERLERAVYLSEDGDIEAKFVRGRRLF